MNLSDVWQTSIKAFKQRLFKYRKTNDGGTEAATSGK